MVNYFFDSYAIIELLKRNPGYIKYEEFPLVTTVFNKPEICWWALTHHDENLGRILMRSIIGQEVSDEIVVEAVLFRQKEKKRDLSYADSIGYVFAKHHNLLFLTGDKAFKDLPGVEFVQ